VDASEEKQKLIGELAGVVRGIEEGAYMELLRGEEVVDPLVKSQMQSQVRIKEKYPLAIRNALNPEKGAIISDARDLDIQNFAHRKFEEEIAQKHFGVPPDEFYQIIKEGMGSEAILTTGYLNQKKLPLVLEVLRDDLKQDFEEATTLDDFYQRAEKSVQKAELEARESLQSKDDL
jgi:hypothetical protein